MCTTTQDTLKSFLRLEEGERERERERVREEKEREREREERKERERGEGREEGRKRETERREILYSTVHINPYLLFTFIIKSCTENKITV